MASHILSLTIFILFLISANGRSLQKPQNVDLSHFFSSANAKLKAISRATSNSYITNYTDVLSLGILVKQYPLLEMYTDDPCVSPVWNWIECNSDSTPRVIALDLNNRLLYGQLPDFSSMDALQKIDLSQNSLYGSIPSFLGTFPDLQELNLADNFFYGTVPASLCNKKNLKLTLFGNSDLSTSCSTSNKSPSPPANINFGGSDGGDIYQIPSTRPKKKSNTPKILGGAISAFVVFWAGVGGFAIHRHKAKTKAAVAQASAMPGPTDPNANMPVEEVPMNSRPNHLKKDLMKHKLEVQDLRVRDNAHGLPPGRKPRL